MEKSFERHRESDESLSEISSLVRGKIADDNSSSAYGRVASIQLILAHVRGADALVASGDAPGFLNKDCFLEPGRWTEVEIPIEMITMMKRIAGVSVIGGFLGGGVSLAQSLAPFATTFGPLTSPGDFDATPILTVFGSQRLDTRVNFSAKVTLTPSYGTPAGATETYTVQWNNVALSLSSASGSLSAEPTPLNLGTISHSFTITLPSVRPPGSYGSYTFNFSVSKLFHTDYNLAGAPITTDNFMVVFESLSAPIYSGGKTESGSSTVTIGGKLTAVNASNPPIPEPSEYAALSGWGLLGFALLRRRKS